MVKRRTKKHFPVLDLELPAGKVPLKLWHWGKASIILTNNIKIVNCFVMLFVTAGNASLEVAANALVALLDSRSLSQVRFHRNKLVTELLDFVCLGSICLSKVLIKQRSTCLVFRPTLIQVVSSAFLPDSFCVRKVLDFRYLVVRKFSSRVLENALWDVHLQQ